MAKKNAQSNEMIQMDAAQCTRAARFMIKNKLNLLLVGAPGVAKTAVLETAAKQEGQDLILFHPVISDPTDFKGMPAIMKVPDTDPETGEQIGDQMKFLAQFVPFDNLKRLLTADKPTTAFADDLGQAPPMVQAAWMQLVLARKLDDKTVSDEITFVSASNRKEDKAGVSGILEPLKSRFASIIELVVDHEIWLAWARQAKIHPYVRAFIQVRGRDLLWSFKASNDMTNTPSPRTVEHVSKIMWGRPDPDLRPMLIAGAAGGAFSTEFEAFIKVVKNLPKISAIIKQPKKCPVPPDSEVGSQYAIVEAMLDNADKKVIKPFLQYISRFKPEFQQWFTAQLKEIKPECIKTEAYATWAANAGIK
jgi:hypothetical protein